MKKICVITGTRAEYGILYSVMSRIKKHADLTLQIIATGMHLWEPFGLTYKEIEKDDFVIDVKVPLGPYGPSGKEVATQIGTGIIGFTQAYETLKPDIVVVLGDRSEMLAAVVAAAYMNIPIAHISGGDKTMSGLDEPVRHAITKFAAIHFPSTETSAERLKKMGEEEWRIHIVGNPTLDNILNRKIATKEELEKKLGLTFKEPTLLLIQHSVSTEPEKARKQIQTTINAITQLKYETIIIFPNADAGGLDIIDELEKHKEPYLHQFKSISSTDYFGILKYASVLIGNSSSGIVESASFKLPVVNIGIRQEGRERTGNVINTTHDTKEILAGIKKALSKEFKEEINNTKNPYGDGRSGARIAQILADTKITSALIRKRITY
ncbi:MAG: UDP-N-acetylglucosamine 2-epimerase [Nanoarchaeota archaeon]